MRVCLLFLAAAACAAAADSRPAQVLQGTLIVREGKVPAVKVPGGVVVTLEGDRDTMKILADKRLDSFEVRAQGRFSSTARFVVDPIHTGALLVRSEGRLKMVTYWCDVCSIRANTPGPCACCQRETTLDLRDPGER